MLLLQIVLKSIRFDKSIYLEAKSNPGFNKFSVLIVLLVGFCTGIGTYNITNDSSVIRDLLSSVIGWLIWTVLIFLIGVNILKNKASFSELARSLGIAFSPGVFNILGLISFISIPLFAVTSVWTIISFIFALKHALEIPAERAFAIALISFFPYIIFRLLIFLI